MRKRRDDTCRERIADQILRNTAPSVSGDNECSLQLMIAHAIVALTVYDAVAANGIVEIGNRIWEPADHAARQHLLVKLLQGERLLIRLARIGPLDFTNGRHHILMFWYGLFEPSAYPLANSAFTGSPLPLSVA